MLFKGSFVACAALLGQLCTSATASFLNDNTKPFAVDGASLPLIPFDIGESYAGLLPTDSSNDKNLFFWFAPQNGSANSQSPKKQIIIWLNGRCSSMIGFLLENGPASWRPGTNTPIQNPFAWTQLANVVWVDQPVGIGYATGTPNATSEYDVADQFLGFWKNFVDLFALHEYEIYLTGESYAGLYIPFITDGMIQRNDTSYFDAKGVAMFDPAIGPDAQFTSKSSYQVTTVATAVDYVDYHYNVFPFNSSFTEHLHNVSASCGYDDFASKALTFPPSGNLPTGPEPALRPDGTWDPSCNIVDEIYAAATLLNPCFDVNYIFQLCPSPSDVLGGSMSPENMKPAYADRDDVKQALHIPTSQKWAACGADPLGPNGTHYSPILPDGPIPSILDSGRPVVLVHGLLDFVLTSNGSLAWLNNMTWNGALGFSQPPLDQLSVDAPGSAVGEVGHYISERGMTFLEFYSAGHLATMWAPAAASKVVEWLLDGAADGGLKE